MKIGKFATIEQLVIDAYSKGTSLREIGKFHGIHFCSVRRILVQRGVKLRPPGGKKKE